MCEDLFWTSILYEPVDILGIGRIQPPSIVEPSRAILVTTATELSAAVAEPSRDGTLRVRGRTYLVYESAPLSEENAHLGRIFCSSPPGYLAKLVRTL